MSLGKTIIAGGRDFKPSEKESGIIVPLIMGMSSEIVSGGCSGADVFGERCGKFLGIPVKLFLADWKKHGKAAGPIRNKQMAEYADSLIVFPGGKGTASMKHEAKLNGLTIIEITPGKKVVINK